MYSFSAPAADSADVLRAVQALETFFENAKVDPVQCAYCATSFDAQDAAGLWAFGAGEDPPEEGEDWFRLDAEQFRLKDLWDQAEGVFFEVAYRGRRPPKEAYIGCVIPFPLIGVPDQSDYEPPPDLEARMAMVDAIHAQFENPLSAECKAAIEELNAVWGKADKERIAKRRAASPLPARTLIGPARTRLGLLYPDELGSQKVD